MKNLNSAFQRAADYATKLGYNPGSGEWWKMLRHGLHILATGQRTELEQSNNLNYTQPTNNDNIPI